MNCKQFAQTFSSDALLPPPDPVASRFHYWMHWFICPFCRRYWKELRELGARQRAQASLANHPAIRISEIKKRVLLHVLKYGKL